MTSTILGSLNNLISFLVHNCISQHSVREAELLGYMFIGKGFDCAVVGAG